MLGALFACQGVLLLAFLGEEGTLLVALALQVEAEVGELLFAAADDGGLVAAVARVLLEVLHLQVTLVVQLIVVEEPFGVEVEAEAVERLHHTGIFRLHVLNLVAHHAQRVLGLHNLPVEDGHLAVDVVDEACALVDALLDEVDLLGRVLRVLARLVEVVREAGDFFLYVGFLAFELFFVLPLGGHGTKQQRHKDCRDYVIVSSIKHNADCRCYC